MKTKQQIISRIVTVAALARARTNGFGHPTGDTQPERRSDGSIHVDGTRIMQMHGGE